jgi:hypothetical protein
MQIKQETWDLLKRIADYTGLSADRILQQALEDYMLHTGLRHVMDNDKDVEGT